MSASPREVFTQLLTGITERRFDELARLYTPDCVVDHPFALPAPTRMRGRAELAAHFAAGAELGLRMRADDVVVHETTDPEVVVAEWTYRITTPTGTEATTANLIVLRVRDGEIVSSRDFHNHAAMAAVLA